MTPDGSVESVPFDRKVGDERIELHGRFLEVGLIRAYSFDAQLNAGHVLPNECIQLAGSSVQADRAAEFILHVAQRRLAVKVFHKPTKRMPKRHKLLCAE